MYTLIRGAISAGRCFKGLHSNPEEAEVCSVKVTRKFKEGNSGTVTAKFTIQSNSGCALVKSASMESMSLFKINRKIRAICEHKLAGTISWGKQGTILFFDMSVSLKKDRSDF